MNFKHYNCHSLLKVINLVSGGIVYAIYANREFKWIFHVCLPVGDDLATCINVSKGRLKKSWRPSLSGLRRRRGKELGKRSQWWMSYTTLSCWCCMMHLSQPDRWSLSWNSKSTIIPGWGLYRKKNPLQGQIDQFYL